MRRCEGAQLRGTDLSRRASAGSAVEATRARNEHVAVLRKSRSEPRPHLVASGVVRSPAGIPERREGPRRHGEPEGDPRPTNLSRAGSFAGTAVGA